MAAIRIDGTMTYRRDLVIASVVIAVVTSAAALWCAVALDGGVSIAAASVGFAVAVCAMHYVAMAAVRVHLSAGVDVVGGVSPVVLVVPIVVIAIAALLGLVFGALTMMSDEEFTRGRGLDGGPSRLGGAAKRRAAVVRPRESADDRVPGGSADGTENAAMPGISPTYLPASGREPQSAELRSHRSRG